MPTDFSFRLSMYLSLALACACLGYAEADLLPSGAVIAVLVVGLLVAVFRSEGRYELGLEAANQVGVVLFVAAAVWLVTQLASRSSLIRTIPPPASLLPYIGTMLMVAMPAKLLRPTHAGDWWALQGMGLVAVALACALADDGVFGVLLVMYAVTAVGGLALFYVKREAGQVPPAPRDPWLVGSIEWLLRRRFSRPPVAPPAVVASVPARVRGAWRPAVGWLSIALLVALPLFFITPRSGAPRFSVGGTSLETGYDSPQMVDLTRTGDLQMNTEVAFEVVVTDGNDQPYDSLPLTQRWRGVAYASYKDGRWQGTALNRVIEQQSQAVFDQKPAPRRPAQPARPPFRPDMFLASYTPRADKTLFPPLADPVRWEVGTGSPVWTLARTGRQTGGLPWMQKTDTAFNAMVEVRGGQEAYVQYIYPPQEGEPDLGTGFDPYGYDPTRLEFGALAGGLPLHTDPLGGIELDQTLRVMLPGLKELPLRTRELLDELVATGKLSAWVTASPGFRREGRPEPADWEAVAAAFRDHLSGGQYEYTLKLRRQDKGSDPVEDFLYRTKASNCERFAAGLVMLCRAVGVPARYVLGFKGHEPAGEGRYYLRQDHAHAWAEVLVPRRAATPAGFRWHWLSMDPTPDGGDGTDPTSLLGSAARGGRSFFSQFIIGYNSERQREAVETVFRAVTAPQFVVGLGSLLGVVGVAGAAWQIGRVIRSRQVVPAAAVGWYARLLDVLNAAGHPLPPGQTPAEFARAIRPHLPDTVAEVPAELTELFYRERFGASPLSATDLVRVDDALQRLERAVPKG